MEPWGRSFSLVELFSRALLLLVGLFRRAFVRRIRLSVGLVITRQVPHAKRALLKANAPYSQQKSQGDSFGAFAFSRALLVGLFRRAKEKEAY
jgi:hypothetical protein